MAVLWTILLYIFAFQVAACLLTKNVPKRSFGHITGQRWDMDRGFEGFNVRVGSAVMEAPSSVPSSSLGTLGDVALFKGSFATLGDYHERQPTEEEREDLKRKYAFNLNVGKAMETLRRELPMVFAASNLDFSIFAQQITVVDQRQNKAVMPKSLYMAGVKSLRMASAISSMYPSMNVKKIEYSEAESTIQCLVDVVLPDAVRIDGQAVWEGMFFFGLDEQGFINSHVFDRKVSNMSPKPLYAHAMNLPWLRSTPVWSPDLLSPVPTPSYAMEQQSSPAVAEHVASN